MNQSKEQLDRFKEAARTVGADESDDALDRIMGKLDLTKKPDLKLCAHASDCAVHSPPAYPAGPCDCNVKAARKSDPCLCHHEHSQDVAG